MEDGCICHLMPANPSPVSLLLFWGSVEDLKSFSEVLNELLNRVYQALSRHTFFLFVFFTATTLKEILMSVSTIINFLNEL